jgi:hypothetical protein
MAQPPPPPYGTPTTSPSPYGGPGIQPGYGPPVPGTNVFAVLALVCGVLAFCGLGLLSIVFGILALVQCRKTGQKGRGMAITGMILTGAWVAIGVIVAIVIVAAGVVAERDSDGTLTESGRITVTTLQPGDCIERLQEGRSIESVPAVPCSEPHMGEVYALFNLTDGDWPGENIVLEQAEVGCVDRLFDYSQSAFDDESVDIFYFHPTRLSWQTGDREVVCVTYYYLDGPRTGSIQGD